MISEELKCAKTIYDKFRQVGEIQEIVVATKVGISDILKLGSRSLKDICQEAKIDQNITRRLMRALVGQGYYVETSKDVFKNTTLGDRLCKDDPLSLHPYILFMDQVEQQAWGRGLERAVRTGDVQPFEHVFGDPLFKYLENHKEEQETFNDYMRCGVRVDNPTLSKLYDFSEFETLCDVAGGTGTFLVEILEQCPKLQGILFDQDQVIQQSKREMERQKIAERVQYTSGSFFQEIPKSQGYILKRILHDFCDEDCIKIVSNIRQRIQKGGKLFIVEKVISDNNLNELAKHEDLCMLILPGGRERSQSEFLTILEKSGFNLQDVLKSSENTSNIVVAIPV